MSVKEKISTLQLEISMLKTAVNYLHSIVEEIRIKETKIKNGIRV